MNTKPPHVIMPQMSFSTAVNLYERIVELLGKPKWEDMQDNGHYRMKWLYEFPFETALQVKEIINSYPNYFVTYFNPSYRATEGKGEGKPRGVIKTCVNPRLMKYPYTDQISSPKRA